MTHTHIGLSNVYLVLHSQLLDSDGNVGKHTKQQPEATVQQQLGQLASCGDFVLLAFCCLGGNRAVSELYCESSDCEGQLELPRQSCPRNFCCAS